MKEGRVDDLDRMLSSDETLTPSSGFATRVMEAVHDAAVEPPPLPFPWWRFAAGLCACIVSAAAGAVLLNRVGLSVVSVELAPVASELAYATAAAVGSVTAVRLRRTFSATR